MSLIGVVCKKSKQEEICNKIQHILNKDKETIIPIFDKDIENIKNVRFETILITENKKNEKQIELKNIIQNAKNIIVDVDYDENLNLLKNIKCNIISYGFNSKATVTASSVEEDKVLICIQREFFNATNKVIHLQEFNIQSDEYARQLDVHDIMGLVSLELFYQK